MSYGPMALAIKNRRSYDDFLWNLIFFEVLNQYKRTLPREKYKWTIERLLETAGLSHSQKHFSVKFLLPLSTLQTKSSNYVYYMHYICIYIFHTCIYTQYPNRFCSHPCTHNFVANPPGLNKFTKNVRVLTPAKRVQTKIHNLVQSSCVQMGFVSFAFRIVASPTSQIRSPHVQRILQVRAFRASGTS